MNKASRKRKWIMRSAVAAGAVGAIAAPVALTACGTTETRELVANITYRASDPFIKVYADRINSKLGTTYTMLTGDGAESQDTQNNLIDTYINRGVSALIVNPVQPTAVSTVIKKAKDAQKPLVLYNREAAAGTSGTDLTVRQTTMAAYDQVAYVGIQAATQGEIQAQMVYDDIKAKRLKDNNGDGKLKFAIIRGQAGHPDAIDRSKAFLPKLKALITASAVTLVKAADNSTSVQITGTNFDSVFTEVGQNQWTDWSATKGQEQSETLINSNPDIDIFVCNNDDTATGVVSTLKAKNKTAFDASTYPTATVTTHIGLYGVDATPTGLANVRDGWFNGTVLNNNLVQADLINLMVRDVLSSAKAWKTSYQLEEPYSKTMNTYTMDTTYKAFYVPSNAVATYLDTWNAFKDKAA